MCLGHAGILLSSMATLWLLADGIKRCSTAPRLSSSDFCSLVRNPPSHRSIGSYGALFIFLTSEKVWGGKEFFLFLSLDPKFCLSLVPPYSVQSITWRFLSKTRGPWSKPRSSMTRLAACSHRKWRPGQSNCPCQVLFFGASEGYVRADWFFCCVDVNATREKKRSGPVFHEPWTTAVNSTRQLIQVFFIRKKYGVRIDVFWGWFCCLAAVGFNNVCLFYTSMTASSLEGVPAIPLVITSFCYRPGKKERDSSRIPPAYSSQYPFPWTLSQKGLDREAVLERWSEKNNQ